MCNSGKSRFRFNDVQFNSDSDSNSMEHRFTYPKGDRDSYRYFIQPMHTPNCLPLAHAYSPILLFVTYAYTQLDLLAYTMVYALAVHLHQFDTRFTTVVQIEHILWTDFIFWTPKRSFFSWHASYMHEQITKEFERRKYLYECTPFGYVNLWEFRFQFWFQPYHFRGCPEL